MDEHDRQRVAASLLFQGIQVEAVPQLWAQGSVREAITAGTVVLSPAVDNRSVYVILDGQVDIHLDVPGPRPDRVLGPGHCFGELSLIDGQRPSATVIAGSTVRLFVLDQDLLWSLVETSPALGRNLLYILCGRTRLESEALVESQRARQALEQAVTVDGLTGLRNRRFLNEVFPRQLERCLHAGQPVSLLVMDIDHFKKFNDTHGHLGGDVALRTTARVLDSSLRPGDLLARYGGEEFVALLTGAALQDALEVGERLRATVEKTPLLDDDGQPLPSVTVSIGAAQAAPGEALTAVIGRADRALYEAKDKGRNQVRG